MRIEIPEGLSTSSIESYSARNDQEFDYLLISYNRIPGQYLLITNKGSLESKIISLGISGELFLGKVRYFPYIHFFTDVKVKSYNVVTNLFEERITYIGNFQNNFNRIIQLKDYFSLGAQVSKFYRYDSVSEIDLTTHTKFQNIEGFTDSNIGIGNGNVFEIVPSSDNTDDVDNGRLMNLGNLGGSSVYYSSDLYSAGRVVVDDMGLNTPFGEIYLQSSPNIYAYGNYIFLEDYKVIDIVDEIRNQEYILPLASLTAFTSSGIYFITEKDVTFTSCEDLSNLYIFEQPPRFIMNSVENLLNKHNINHVFVSDGSVGIDYTENAWSIIPSREKKVFLKLSDIDEIIPYPIGQYFLNIHFIGNVIMFDADKEMVRIVGNTKFILCKGKSIPEEPDTFSPNVIFLDFKTLKSW